MEMGGHGVQSLVEVVVEILPVGFRIVVHLVLEALFLWKISASRSR
jgi:hypothetical protein